LLGYRLHFETIKCVYFVEDSCSDTNTGNISRLQHQKAGGANEEGTTREAADGNKVMNIHILYYYRSHRQGAKYCHNPKIVITNAGFSLGNIVGDKCCTVQWATFPLSVVQLLCNSYHKEGDSCCETVEQQN